MIGNVQIRMCQANKTTIQLFVKSKFNANICMRNGQENKRR